jgi:hypothetical protein
MKLFVSLFVLLLPIVSSFGQFKNIKLDEQSEGQPIYDPSIAVNPKNPLNIVAASALNNIYVTKDGGLTWQKKVMKSSFGVDGHPALIADGSGTFFFFHRSDPTNGKGGYDSEKSDRIVVQRSDDGGDTWDDGTSIGFNQPKDQDKPRPTIDSKGNLVLAWTQFDSYGSKSSGCQSTILLSTSKNGSKWSEAMVISQIPGNCLDSDSTVAGAMPAITFDGKAFVAWAVNEKIYLDRSFDGKLWLSNDIPILDQKRGWDLKIPGHGHSNGLPFFMTDRSKTGFRGYLYVVLADQRSGENDTDVWFSRSTNYGDNWSISLNVSIAKKNHQYLPSMTIDQANGNIYVMYYDRSEHDDLKTDVYLAWSIDGGNTFKNARISESPFIPGEQTLFGNYTNISAHKGIITPIWTRMDNGKTSIWTLVIKHSDLDALTVKK